MSQPAGKPSYVRQLKLPSGRHIQVVYYDSVGEPDDNDPGPCGTCGCALLQPLSADPLGASYWRVLLRCPNCLWSGTGVYSQDALERFEELRAQDTEALRGALEQLALANMVEDTERFVRALDGDHILPSDF